MAHSDGVELAAEALRAVGVQVKFPVTHDLQQPDLVLEPGHAAIQVKRWSLVDHQVATRVMANRSNHEPVLLAVGDRVTDEARRILLKQGAGYLDLRGQLALRTEHLLINTAVDSLSPGDGRRNALAGKAGLEVATALLMRTGPAPAVRELARQLDRSPSTVSEVVSLLRRDGLIDDKQRVEGNRLFWQVAERWMTPRRYLAEIPPPRNASRISGPLRLGLEDVEGTPGWALTDAQAAVAFGAPVAVRSDQRLEFYVPDRVVQQRAQKLLGDAASPSGAACAVRVAPVRAVCAQRVEVARNPTKWPLAHPLFVALDLAQDSGRGRDVLDAWTPPSRWHRVW